MKQDNQKFHDLTHAMYGALSKAEIILGLLSDKTKLESFGQPKEKVISDMNDTLDLLQKRWRDLFEMTKNEEESNGHIK